MISPPRPRTSALLGLTLFGASLCHAAPVSSWKLTSFGSTDKLLATSRNPLKLDTFAPRPIQLDAVRGENLSFQFVVSAGQQPIQTVTVRPNGLATILSDFLPADQFSFFRENYVFVAHPSGNRIQTPKWWPDALVPLQLAPQTIEANSSAVFWTTLHIPQNAAPGDYYGELDIAANGENHRLALTVHVRPLQLPASSFRGTVALYYDTLRDWYHKSGRDFSDADWLLQKRRYANFLLDFGLNPYDPPVSWNDPTLDDYLKDPRVQSVRTPPLDSPDFPLALAAFKRTATQNKAFYYWIDEPQSAEQFAAVKATTKKLRELGIPHLVTAHPNTELANDVDIWCPNIGDALGAGHLDARQLRAQQKNGHPTWLYTMVVPKHPYPTWLLDDDSSAILGYAPLWAKLGATGFVYSMVHGWGPHPLDDLTSYAGTNGDGTLLYPAELVGGVGPMPSIRLMLLRDAIEDFGLSYQAVQKGFIPSFAFPATRTAALLYDRTPLLDALELGHPSKNVSPPTPPQLFADTPISTAYLSPLTAHLTPQRQVQAQLSGGGVLRVEFQGPPLAPTDSLSVALALPDIQNNTEQWRLNFTSKDGLQIEHRSRTGRSELKVPAIRAVAIPSVVRFWIPLRALGLDQKSVRFNATQRTSTVTRLFADANDPFLMPLLKESQVKTRQPKATGSSRNTPKTP